MSDTPEGSTGLQVLSISPGDGEAKDLIAALDAEIRSLYPGQPVNGIDVAEFEHSGGYFVLARRQGAAVGCGAFRPVGHGCAEIKRMFVRGQARRCGIARRILQHLEAEIRRQGFRSIVLETGCQNSAARTLYESAGYFPIPPFLGYVGSPISCCYAKQV